MSEPIPESIPTSADPRSKRPIKKSRPNPSANPLAADVDSLFANPEKEVSLPLSSAEIAAREAARAAASIPEIVANVQGSSAGAGSGEFHVYKASRRREYERVRKMEEEVEKEQADAEWEKKQEEKRRQDEEKAAKNRAKREKKKKKGGKGGDQKTAGSGSAAGGVSKVDSSTNGAGGAAKSDKDGASNGTDFTQENGAATNPDEIGVVIHDDDD